MAPKRSGESTGKAPKPKKQKTMPPMQKTSHASDTPGWISDTEWCSPAVTWASSSNELATMIDSGKGQQTFKESDLVGKGDRELNLIDQLDDASILVEDASKYNIKYVSKDAQRLCSMLSSLKNNYCDEPKLEIEEYYPKGLLLLGAQQPICRNVVLPCLQEMGVLVFRRAE